MYIIRRDEKKIEQVDEVTFTENNFYERYDLQEWICKEPTCLNGEDLLIIQKEFDNWNNSSKRLDLVALDKKQGLVVIENKLDNTGREAVAQVLSYASFCSTLKTGDIIRMYQDYLDRWDPGKDAETEIEEFYDLGPGETASLPLNENDVRMIIVSRTFEPEITSTVMWLLNHDIKIQLIKTSLYRHGADVFLDFDVIIPVKEAADYYVHMADKQKSTQIAKDESSERKNITKEFWTLLLERLQYSHFDKFQNVSPTTDAWLGCGSGHTGIPFKFVFNGKYARLELTINAGNEAYNKLIFDRLSKFRNEVDTEFGPGLVWDRLEGKKSSRVVFDLAPADIMETDSWDDVCEWMCTNIKPFYTSLKKALDKVDFRAE